MISIVMPTYNQGRYLRESLDSILAQTYPHWELVVVDDGSTDETPQILDQCRDPRIRVVRKDNGGTGAALNMGFCYTSGDLETWWASDNVMFPECLARLVQYLEQHPDVDYVYSHCEIRQMDESGQRVIGTKPLLAEVKSQDWSLERFKTHYFLGVCWLWRRDLRERAGSWFQVDPCEDYEMTLRMAYGGGRFAHIPETLGWFRRHNRNMSTQIKGAGYPARAKQRALEAAREQGHAV